MKVIKYKMGEALVKMGWSEENLEIAKREANGGSYSIEDDGQPEPQPEITTEERLDALEAALLEMMGVNVDG